LKYHTPHSARHNPVSLICILNTYSNPCSLSSSLPLPMALPNPSTHICIRIRGFIPDSTASRVEPFRPGVQRRKGRKKCKSSRNSLNKKLFITSDDPRRFVRLRRNYVAWLYLIIRGNTLYLVFGMEQARVFEIISMETRAVFRERKFVSELVALKNILIRLRVERERRRGQEIFFH